MTGNEKALWNTFKRACKRELSNTTNHIWGFAMTGRQIQLRTATIAICFDMDYQAQIDRKLSDLARVMTYDTWSDESKQRLKESVAADVEALKQRIMAFGNPQNEARVALESITSSECFHKFSEAIGGASAHIDYANNMYYVRVNW